jgi:hypothetical protein
MPLTCEYCGLVFWNSQDQTAHPIPCRPGVAPGSTSIGVPPGELTAPLAVPLPPGVVLAADSAAVGLMVEGSPL